eukprot:SAG31_NODE_383_length_16451_cov_8.412977_7_plen_360_part_00
MSKPDPKSSSRPLAPGKGGKAQSADDSEPSPALIDAVSKRVVAGLGDLLDSKLAALQTRQTSGVPTATTVVPPPTGQQTPQPGASQRAGGPPPGSPGSFAGAPPLPFGGLSGGSAYPPRGPQAATGNLAAAGVAGFGNPGLAQQLPLGLADVVPHLDLKYPTPKRLARRQAQGFVVPTDLWADDEYARIVPGYDKLSPGHQAELSYSLVVHKRLDDVQQYIEAVSRNEVAFDLRRLHGVLGEIQRLGGERVDGVVHLAAIKAKHSSVQLEETAEAQLAAMSAKQRKRQSALPADARYANVYQKEAAQLHEAVEKKVQTLIAAPHAYAQVRSQYGAAAANKAFGWANYGGTAQEPGGESG